MIYMSKRTDAHLEELVHEELDAHDSGAVTAIDLGCLPSSLLDKQIDERVAPIAELHCITLALAGIVVGGLYGLIVRHILDHHTGARDSGGCRTVCFLVLSSLSLLHLLLRPLFVSLLFRWIRSFYHSRFRAMRADAPESTTVKRTSAYLSLAAYHYAAGGHTAPMVLH